MFFNKDMLTLHLRIHNSINQKTYNQIIDSLQIYTLKCPSCGHSGSLRKHGYYHRYIKTQGNCIKLTILRLKCMECGHTHAILIDAIVPYSQYLLKDQLAVITAQNNRQLLKELMDENYYIDESVIYRIRKRYEKYWKERLFCFEIKLELTSITMECFSKLNRQFMQIHSTVNRLYRANHITFLQTSISII